MSSSLAVGFSLVAGVSQSAGATAPGSLRNQNSSATVTAICRPAVSGAASEDGQKQYMSVPHHDSISGMTSLTLALWLNPAEVVEMEATLLEKASAYRLSLMPASNDWADMRVRVRLDDDFDWTVDVPLLGE